MAACSSAVHVQELGTDSVSRTRALIDRRWLTVTVVALNSSLNAVLSCNYSVVEEVTQEALHTDDVQISFLYSAFLIIAAVGMTPGMMLAARWEGVALGCSVLLNVGASWLRWIASEQESYRLSLISTVMCALGTCTMLTLPAQVSQQRFPPDLWTFATSLMVQANYFGWLVGSVVPPQCISGVASFKHFMLYQAMVASMVLVAFVLMYRPVLKVSARSQGSEASASFLESRERPQAIQTEDDNHAPGGLLNLLGVAMAHPRFALQVGAFGLMGGVSFSQPSAGIFILQDYGFSNQVDVWVNMCFIGTGIVFGIVVGKFCNEPRFFGITLKAMFVVCALCTGISAVLAASGFLNSNNIASFILICVLSAGTGATSIGFIGIGIEAAALYPVGGAYACWLVEIIVQVAGGVISQEASNSNGFMVLAVVQGFATIVFLFSFKSVSFPASQQV
uniref:Major facilitator superfamily (MFS) profile domain-containing protein n=1 Tax=Noctiluca scintillans TaxID=2966 RepID=A0A7S1FJP5_NOCSC